MRGTDVGISKKKNFPVFYGSLRSKKEGKTKFFLQSAPFGQFTVWVCHFENNTFEIINVKYLRIKRENREGILKNLNYFTYTLVLKKRSKIALDTGLPP